ncbi:MAG: hypothetical protein ACFFDT_21885 [Candidatus Hodarchaeota archaeon]
MRTPHVKIKYPTSTQLEFWHLKRIQQSGRDIAKHKKISEQAVSKTLKEANARIRALIENSASMNKIKLELINEELGVARGYSCVFKVKVYITYSPHNGVQVWYDHQGACEECEEFMECRRRLLLEFKERNIVITRPTLRPTELAKLLFQKIEEKLK